jgi:hypothetical protein
MTSTRSEYSFIPLLAFAGGGGAAIEIDHVFTLQALAFDFAPENCSSVTARAMFGPPRTKKSFRLRTDLKLMRKMESSGRQLLDNHRLSARPFSSAIVEDHQLHGIGARSFECVVGGVSEVISAIAEVPLTISDRAVRVVGAV